MILTYIKIGAAVLLIGGAFWSGHKVTSNAWKADMLEVEIQNAEALRHATLRGNMIAAQLEAEKAKSHVVYKTITKRVEKVVDRVVYSNVCIDDDGLQLINSALAGKAPVEPKPADGVPAPRPLRR